MGLELTLRIDMFQWCCLATLVGCLPAPIWDAVEARVAKPLGQCSKRFVGLLQQHRNGANHKTSKATQSPSRPAQAYRVGAWASRRGRSFVSILILLLAFGTLRISCSELHRRRGAETGLMPPFCTPVLWASFQVWQFVELWPPFFWIFRVLDTGVAF